MHVVTFEELLALVNSQLPCIFILFYLFFIYYKVSYIKYRNLHKQRTAQTTWKVQKARTVQLGAANRRKIKLSISDLSKVIPFVKMLECSRRSSNSCTKSSDYRCKIMKIQLLEVRRFAPVSTSLHSICLTDKWNVEKS